MQAEDGANNIAFEIHIDNTSLCLDASDIQYLYHQKVHVPSLDECNIRPSALCLAFPCDDSMRSRSQACRAAREAFGCKDILVVYEPYASRLSQYAGARGAHRQPALGTQTLVFDLGAGTLCAVLLSADENGNEHVVARITIHRGGHDVTTAMQKMITREDGGNITREEAQAIKRRELCKSQPDRRGLQSVDGSKDVTTTIWDRKYMFNRGELCNMVTAFHVQLLLDIVKSGFPLVLVKHVKLMGNAGANDRLFRKVVEAAFGVVPYVVPSPATAVARGGHEFLRRSVGSDACAICTAPLFIYQCAPLSLAPCCT